MFEILYFLVLPIAFRYHAGAILNGVCEDDDREGGDYFVSAFFGLMTMWFWPLTLAGRLLYIAGKKSGVSPKNVETVFFAKPREIETRDERRKRTEREQREHHAAQMRLERVKTLQARERTNQLEAENGIPLTKWEN